MFTRVNFVLEPNQAPLASPLLPIEQGQPDDSLLTEEVWLLDQNDSTYFILIPNGRKRQAIEIGKDLIKGVIHEEK